MFGISDMVSSGINFAGGLIQQNSNAKMAAAQRQADERGAERAMAFQERMSGSAHQREVLDLRAAGLNPILSGTGGPGSSTPAGAKAGAALQAPSSNVLGEAVSTALEARRNRAQVLNMEEQNEQIRADTQLKKQDTVLRAYQMDATKAQERLTNQEAALARENTLGATHQASILGHSAAGAKLEGDMDRSTYGEIMRYINRALGAVNAGTSAFRNLRNPIRQHQRVPPPRR